ncbi:unnamed protein product [Rotaria magnacalcarata]|uniref:Uncharacterized protein n=1 Tax=Rotaria magnacalcarata TaxID=392030 RepID=A0A816P1U5_9BILA|nr:unnamed protein product [Rotaria magnacalcarata]CAF2167681.1 unnamed protein product [Rotaria magnacalcarata]CAF3908366.1 unnamed protein product [Rotaria magnacalcarata]CAF3973707.1 unnamed protein product [Rotaria magnacalcarata]
MSLKRLDCDGLACRKCHKCTHWELNGNNQTWNWIKEANSRGWPKEDIDCWHNDRDGRECLLHDNLPLVYHDHPALADLPVHLRADLLPAIADDHRRHMCFCD